MWSKVIWLFLLFLLGKHMCFPSSPRYLELADSADYFISKQNWPAAENKIIQALRLEPANFSNSLLLANLGLVQANQGEYKKAIESLSLGLNIAPSSTVLLNNRAHTYLMVDSVNAAIRDIDKSLSVDSLQEWTLATRAYLYLQDNNLGEAKKLFYKLQQEFPDNPAVYSGLGAIAEASNDLPQAIELYKKALGLKPENDEDREALILAYIKNNDYTSARTEIHNGLKINPENPMFYLLRGYLHRLNYRMDEAAADKKLAIRKGLDPKYVSQYIP